MKTCEFPPGYDEFRDDIKAIDTLLQAVTGREEINTRNYPDLLFGEGLALVANLVNMVAKFEPSWYDLKPYLVNSATKEALSSRYDREGGVVYIETPHKQVSFHVFEEETNLPYDHSGRNSNEWDGGGGQDVAVDLIEKFVDIYPVHLDMP